MVERERETGKEKEQEQTVVALTWQEYHVQVYALCPLGRADPWTQCQARVEQIPVQILLQVDLQVLAALTQVWQLKARVSLPALQASLLAVSGCHSQALSRLRI